MSGAKLVVPSLRRDESLVGKTAIVTGGGSSGELAGTGAAISIVLAARGAQVVIVEIDEARAQHTADAILDLGGSSAVAIGDLTRQDDCERAVRTALDRFGSVDVLVNNAAIAPNEPEFELTLWQRVLDLNLTAPMLMMNAVLPQMRAQGSGSIVNITSIASLQAGGGPAYSAAKAGLTSLGRAIAQREGENGIRVNDVAPGHVAIPMGLGFQGWSRDLTAGDTTRKRRAHATMLGTEGTGWDIATAVAFYAGDDSRYVTATTMPVDGGTTSVFPLVMWQKINEREGS